MTKCEADIFSLALMILNNACPPDNTMYLCNMGEECEYECTRCWSNYLYYAINGYDRNPYRFDRKQDVQE